MNARAHHKLTRNIGTFFASAYVFTAIAAPPPCAQQPPKSIDMKIVELNFKELFCTRSPAPACETRWRNITPLIEKLIGDPRVTTVGTAAYILATVSVETGVTNFDPASREQKKPVAEYCAGMLRPPTPCPYFGRGWVQLTYFDKYQRVKNKLGIDVVEHPELAEMPANSYEILVGGMTEGTIENYRGTPGGGCPNAASCSTPIRLSDFVNASSVDYERARSVINANCVNPKSAGKPIKPVMKLPCVDVQYHNLGFIPTVDRLDVATEAAGSAKKFEGMLCKGMSITP